MMQLEPQVIRNNAGSSSQLPKSIMSDKTASVVNQHLNTFLRDASKKFYETHYDQQKPFREQLRGGRTSSWTNTAGRATTRTPKQAVVNNKPIETDFFSTTDAESTKPTKPSPASSSLMQTNR